MSIRRHAVDSQLIDAGPVVDKHTCPRVAAVRDLDPDAAARVVHLAHVAVRGMPAAYLPATGEFAQTVRGVTGAHGAHLRQEGTNLRYAAIAALGLDRLPRDVQRDILSGRDAAEIAVLAAQRAEHSPDPGAVAVSAWAAAEITGTFPTALVRRLTTWLDTGRALPTVDAAWLLTAAVAANRFGDTDALVMRAASLLQRHIGPGGTHPHVLPPDEQSRWRAHVGSFADQVYPLQALARASVLTGERWMLDTANRTANQLCNLQGRGGQWWWHYDSRTGDVVEGYPVYSVHQHAMAPMVLFDLWEAGGADHRAEIARGLQWLDRHPEVVEELVSDRFGLVWRKVGRREPRKAARMLGAATTSFAPRWRTPGLDRLLPPVVVDHECRPYELGWLLYAWLPAGGPGGEARA
jgi:hypothetical protein